MAYPASIDSFTVIAGTTLVATDDHANRINRIGSAIGSIESVIGTNTGTAVLKNFTVGIFAAKQNNETFGTSTWIGGTIGTTIVGTSTVQGGTVRNAMLGTNTITGGTLNTVTIGTPTIVGGSIAVSGTAVALSVGGGLVPSYGSVADAAGGTLTVNAQASNIYRSIFGTAAGNRTIGTPQNATDGQSLTYGLKASGSANGTLLWTGIFRFSDYGTPGLGTASTWNYYSYRYNGVDTKWDLQGVSKNII